MSATPETEAEIRRLHYAEHWPVGTISTELSVRADMVKRVLGLLTPRAPQPPRPRMVDGFEGFIEQTLLRYPTLKSMRLYDMVKPRGYEGSVRTLREYVALVRPRAPREVFLRTEPLVGEQAQVDWAHVGKLRVPGGERQLRAVVMVLSWSRAMWGEFVFDLSVHSLLARFSTMATRACARSRSCTSSCTGRAISRPSIARAADVDPKSSRSLGLQLVASLSEQLRGTLELDRTAGTRYRIRCHAMRERRWSIPEEQGHHL